MRILVPSLASVVAMGVLAAPALAVEITAVEVGQARVVPKDRKANASIAAAVAVSQRLATARSVANSRREAAEAATMLGVPLGPVRNIGGLSPTTNPFFGFGFSPFGGAPIEGSFGPGKYCGIKTVVKRTINPKTRKVTAKRSRRRACNVPKFAYEQVPLTFGTNPATPDQTVTAPGTGQAEVVPKNRKNNASIAAAVEASRALAMRRALTRAKTRAPLLAERALMSLGDLHSATEADPGFSFFGPGGPVSGTFGPGKYCKGVVAKVQKRDPKTGIKSGPKRTVRRLTCRIPKSVFASWTLTYAASPLGG